MRRTSQIATPTEANRASGPTPDRAPQARALSAAEIEQVAGAQKVREAMAATDRTAN